MPDDPTTDDALLTELERVVKGEEISPDTFRATIKDLMTLWVRSSGRGAGGAVDQKKQWWKRIKAVVEKLIASPNTPPDLLLELTRGFPDAAFALLENPILPLISLEMPDFYEEFSIRAARRLLQLPHLPGKVAEAFTVHPFPWLAFEARTHIALLGEVQISEGTDEGEVAIRLALEWESVMASTIQEIIGFRWLEERAQLWELAEEGFAPDWAVVGSDPEEYPEFQECLSVFPEEVIKIALQSDDPRQYLDDWYFGVGMLNLPTKENWLTPGSVGQHRLARYAALDYSALEKMTYGNYDALLRRALRRHPKADDHLKRKCRLRTILNTVGGIAIRKRSPEPVRWFVLNQLHKLEMGSDYRLEDLRPENLVREYAPSRLALALCLGPFIDWTNPENASYRELLKQDSNRYVRAAARGQWRSWPE